MANKTGNQVGRRNMTLLRESDKLKKICRYIFGNEMVSKVWIMIPYPAGQRNQALMLMDKIEGKLGWTANRRIMREIDFDHEYLTMVMLEFKNGRKIEFWTNHFGGIELFDGNEKGFDYVKKATYRETFKRARGRWEQASKNHSRAHGSDCFNIEEK